MSANSPPKAKRPKLTKAAALSKDIDKLKEAMKEQTKVSESLKFLPDTVKALTEQIKLLVQPPEPAAEAEIDEIDQTKENEPFDVSDLLKSQTDGNYQLKYKNQASKF